MITEETVSCDGCGKNLPRKRLSKGYAGHSKEEHITSGWRLVCNSCREKWRVCGLDPLLWSSHARTEVAPWIELYRAQPKKYFE